jgi:hypothetical protein
MPIRRGVIIVASSQNRPRWTARLAVGERVIEDKHCIWHELPVFWLKSGDVMIVSSI